jgi:hypothetical protein
MATLTFMGHFLKASGRRQLIGLPSGDEPTKEEVYELVYPVGSYYLSMSDTFDPNVSFVGTWVQDTPGLMTMNASDSTRLGATGGEKTHKLTTSEVPGHTHSASGITYQTSKNGSFGNTTQTSYWNNTRGNQLKYERIYDGTLTSSSTGSGTAHNNLQPYIVCVRWHRIA